jgi:hypothetical protein
MRGVFTIYKRPKKQRPLGRLCMMWDLQPENDPVAKKRDCADDECYYTVLIFRRNDEESNVLLRNTPVDVVGVEMMLITPQLYRKTEGVSSVRTIAQQELDCQVYYSDIASTFRSTHANKRNYKETHHNALCIKVSKDEHLTLQQYLVKLVSHHIPYCTASLPLMVVPRVFQRLCSDVPSEEPGAFSTLTSTQAVLFALRNCMERDRSVTSNLLALHSRFVSPQQLYNTVELYARKVTVMPLNIAQVQWRSKGK